MNVASTLMDLLNFQILPQTDTNSLVQAVRSRADAIHIAGEKLISLDDGFVTTELLQNIESKSYNIPFTLVSLQIQSKCLHPNCFLAFYLTCKKFFELLNAETATQFFIEVEDICRGLTDIALVLNRPKMVVKIVRRAIDLSCPRRHLFSPLYADFLQLCIKSQLYGVALDFINSREVLEINDRINSFSEDFMKYFYYSGICFIAVKNYRSALEAFTTCVSTPANALSQIAINSLKKCKIISLLATGEKYDLPRYVPTAVSRYYHEDMQPYDQIVDKYFGDEINDIVQAVYNHEKALQVDNNFGIAKGLVEAWKISRIQKISKSYLTLSMTDITSALNIDDTNEHIEKILFAMIAKEKVIASINSANGIVNFEETVNNQQNFQQKKELLTANIEESLDHILAISNLLRDRQKEILTSQDYIQKNSSSSLGRSSGIGGGGFWSGVASTMEFS